MVDTTRAEDGRYRVVVNDEQQYAFWPADRALPAGWTATGTVGDLDACARYVSEVWTDLRPKSVRAAMAEADDDGRPRAGR
jgi:MbtH protein